MSPRVLRLSLVASLLVPAVAFAALDAKSLTITDVQFSADHDTTTVTLSADPGGKVHIRGNVFPVSLGRDTSGAGYNTQEKVSMLSGWASQFQNTVEAGAGNEFKVVFRVCPYDEPYTGKHTDEYCGKPYTMYVTYEPRPVFWDVHDEHPNADAIRHMREQGIVSGYTDGTFRADQSINRAEFTKIIAAAYGEEELLRCAKEWDLGKMFSDMTASDWYAPYVCVANRHDVINGYPDRTFRGDQLVNFAEAAKMLTFRYNLYGQVTDVWYERGVRALEERGAIPFTITAFDQPITRGEMAEMIYRLNTNTTTKPTQTFQELAGGLAKFRDDDYGVAFQYPSHFTEPTIAYGTFGSNGGLPHVAAISRVNIGPRDAHFQSSMYYIEGYKPGDIDMDEVAQELASDDLVLITSDTAVEGNGRMIVYQQGGMCGNLEALVESYGRTFHLVGKCAADGETSKQTFMQIVNSFIVTD